MINQSAEVDDHANMKRKFHHLSLSLPLLTVAHRSVHNYVLARMAADESTPLRCRLLKRTARQLLPAAAAAAAAAATGWLLVQLLLPPLLLLLPAPAAAAAAAAACC